VSWLRRILGGDGREPGDGEPAGAHDLGYETNPTAAATAKAELLRVLRERGAHAALITYDGGHDEGSVSEIVVSAEPLGAPPEDWREATIAGGERIDMDRAWDVWGSEDLGDDDRQLSELLDAADTFIAAKWEGFAGEFEVQGRVVVDVDGERIARHDAVTVDEEYGGETSRETEVV
jgi:hypothetical protein